MRPLWKDVLAGVLMGFVLPGVLLNFAVLLLRPTTESEEINTVCTVKMVETAPSETAEAPLNMLLQREDGSVEQMDLDDYIVGVVLAEMPVWFAEEALKAQAVVARTYALKAYTTGGKHGNGSVCTRPGCCQAYRNRQDFLDNGGDVQAVEKVCAAVEETSGYVLTFQGELIEATYFSCSGGSTEDAVAVWGTDYPYLRAVDSPGEEEAAHYTDKAFFDKSAFCEALGIEPEGTPRQWLGSVSYTAGGGIEEIQIGERIFSGTQLRQLLGLRSTAISMTAEDRGITVVTRGYGHRVGMSQYGADAMASRGQSYPEILAHYYRGTELIMWSG